MSEEREQRIKEFRLRQPLSELKRRSDKSANRVNLFSQEELDYADALAVDLLTHIRWEEPDVVDVGLGN